MICLKDNAIIISRESKNLQLKDFYSGVDVVLDFKLKNETLIFMKKTASTKATTFLKISDTDEKFNWIDEVKIYHYILLEYKSIQGLILLDNACFN